MTSDAKQALKDTVRSLRARLLADLHDATESAWQMGVRVQNADLDEATRATRATFEDWAADSTLRHALAVIASDWKVSTDNFTVRVRGDALNGEAFDVAMAQLRQEALWQDGELWATVAAGLPGYRLSKFQPLMPEWVEREVLSRYLLDVPGTQRWLCASDAVA